MFHKLSATLQISKIMKEIYMLKPLDMKLQKAIPKKPCVSE